MIPQWRRLYVLGFFPLEILVSHSLHSALEELCSEIEKNVKNSLIWDMEINILKDHPKYNVSYTLNCAYISKLAYE